MKIKIVLLFILFTILLYYINTENQSRINPNLAVAIDEKIVLKLSKLDNWVIIDDYENYIYELNTQSVTTSKILNYYKYPKIIEDNYWKINIDDNKYMQNWIFYVNWKKVYKCVNKFCSFVKSKNWKYLIFVDKKIYSRFFIKKSYWLYIIKVLDINKLEYKIYPELKYNSNIFSIDEFLWYIE